MKTVGLFNPSSPSSKTIDLQCIEGWFKAHGFQVILAPHALDKERFLAGKDIDRAQDFNELVKNPNIDMLVALKGGYGSPRLLDKIDYETARKNKKPLFGFSDTTGLQLALWAKAGWSSFTGLSPARDITPAGLDTLIEEGFVKRIKGENLTYPLSVLYPGAAEGTVIGGTLALIETLIGTPYQPDFKDTILFIEDVREEPYKVDRMLTHLRLAGVFDIIKGLIWGDFFECISSDPNDGTIEEVLLDTSAQIHKNNSIPIMMGLPYGHAVSRTVLPIGISGLLSAAEGTLRV